MNPFCRQIVITLGLALLLGVWPARVHAGPVVDVEVDIDFFHHELAAHGEWFESEAYGVVWTPHHMPPDWRPYTVGHWEFTDDYGWLWVSDHEWGWAPFHYGRWMYDDFHGWVWIPDTEWGPAWVAWREGDGHVGWAPLPPQVEWQVGVGLGSSGFDINVQIHPRCWTFVQERYVLEPHLHVHRIAPARRVMLLRKTKDTTHYLAVDGRVVNRSLSVERVERTLGRRVPRRTIRVMDSASTDRRVRISGGEINLFRPKVVRRVSTKSPSSTKVLKRAPSEGRTTVRRRLAPASGASDRSDSKAKHRIHRTGSKERTSGDGRKVIHRRKASESKGPDSAERTRTKRAPRGERKGKKKP